MFRGLVRIVRREAKTAVAAGMSLAPAHGHGKVVDEPGSRVILILDPVTDACGGVSVLEVLAGGGYAAGPRLVAEDEGDLQSEGHPLCWLPADATVVAARHDGVVEPRHAEQIWGICRK
mgnify:CR=1 FL=1